MSDASPPRPGASASIPRRTIDIVRATQPAKLVRLTPRHDVVIGEAIDAWAHVEVDLPDGTIGQQLLPMVTRDGALALIEDGSYAGVSWG